MKNSHKSSSHEPSNHYQKEKILSTSKDQENPFTAIIFHYFQINTNKDILTVIISK